MLDRENGCYLILVAIKRNKDRIVPTVLKDVQKYLKWLKVKVIDNIKYWIALWLTAKYLKAFYLDAIIQSCQNVCCDVCTGHVATNKMHNNICFNAMDILVCLKTSWRDIINDSLIK